MGEIRTPWKKTMEILKCDQAKKQKRTTMMHKGMENCAGTIAMMVQLGRPIPVKGWVLLLSQSIQAR